ncbi:unnamed protein product [Urochloa humidicola]
MPIWSDRTSSHAPDRPGPARLAHTTFSLPPLLPQGNTSPAYVRRTTPCPRDPAPPRPDLRRRHRSLRRAPYALPRPPPEPLRPPCPVSRAPAGSPVPNPNPSSRRGAVQVRPLLHRALRPASLCPHGAVRSQLRYAECRAVVWVGVLSGQCGETAPAAAELCCIWAGRAWAWKQCMFSELGSLRGHAV